MIAGLLAIAALHAHKIYLLLVVYLGYLADHLITRPSLKRSVKSASPELRPILSAGIKKQDAGIVMTGAVVFAIVAIVLQLS